MIVSGKDLYAFRINESLQFHFSKYQNYLRSNEQ